MWETQKLGPAWTKIVQIHAMPYHGLCHVMFLC